ncbi:MAG: IclR family transcriptional regulator, acetate operon repressor [Candidatus Eremiobacteraeota bacterium]|nr:IclR family transcriptional regulator, acetate operon repressor [Candidatus Eremiobacteraeota bacterium]
MAPRALAGPKNDTLGGVTRALRVLNVFAKNATRRPLSARSVAEQLGMNVSTCYHVLNTLIAERYVVRDPDTGLLTLGPNVAALSRAYDVQLGVTPEIAAIFRDLARDTGENVALGMLQRDTLAIVEVIESVERLRVAGWSPGIAEHLHARALGKAVLAYKDDAFVARHFEREPPAALTPNTRTTLGAIRESLATTRARGYSEDVEEFAQGVCGIGAAFFGAGGEVAGSLVISLPVMRLAEKRPALVRRATEAATAITATLQSTGRNETGD